MFTYEIRIYGSHGMINKCMHLSTVHDRAVDGRYFMIGLLEYQWRQSKCRAIYVQTASANICALQLFY